MNNNELYLKIAQNGQLNRVPYERLEKTLYQTNAVPKEIWPEFLRSVILARCQKYGVLDTFENLKDSGYKDRLSHSARTGLYTTEFAQSILQLAKEQGVFTKGFYDNDIEKDFVKSLLPIFVSDDNTLFDYALRDQVEKNIHTEFENASKEELARIHGMSEKEKIAELLKNPYPRFIMESFYSKIPMEDHSEALCLAFFQAMTSTENILNWTDKKSGWHCFFHSDWIPRQLAKYIPEENKTEKVNTALKEIAYFVMLANKKISLTDIPKEDLTESLCVFAFREAYRSQSISRTKIVYEQLPEHLKTESVKQAYALSILLSEKRRQEGNRYADSYDIHGKQEIEIQEKNFAVLTDFLQKEGTESVVVQLLRQLDCWPSELSAKSRNSMMESIIHALPESEQTAKVYETAVSAQRKYHGDFPDGSFYEIHSEFDRGIGFPLEKVPSAMLSDEIYLIAAKYGQFDKIPEEKRTHEIYKVASTNAKTRISDIPEKERTQDICILLGERPYDRNIQRPSIWDIPQESLTPEVIRAILPYYSKDILALSEIPSDLRDKETCVVACMDNVKNMDFVPKDIRESDDFYMQLLSKTDNVSYAVQLISYLPDSLQQPAMYCVMMAKAYENSGDLLQAIPVEKRTEDVCRCAYACTEFAFPTYHQSTKVVSAFPQALKEELHDLVLDFVGKTPEYLGKVPYWARTLDVCKLAVEKGLQAEKASVVPPEFQKEIRALINARDQNLVEQHQKGIQQQINDMLSFGF